MKDSSDQFIELDHSIDDTVRQAKMQLKIDVRTRELLHANDFAYGYSQENAREQATLDIIGAPAGLEDTN